MSHYFQTAEIGFHMMFLVMSFSQSIFYFQNSTLGSNWQSKIQNMAEATEMTLVMSLSQYIHPYIPRLYRISSLRLFFKLIPILFLKCIVTSSVEELTVVFLFELDHRPPIFERFAHVVSALFLSSFYRFLESCK